MIKLTPWLMDELERRAAAEAPDECCGLIGSNERGIALWAAENAAASPRDSFAISPESQFGILKQMRGRGEELAGVYHSHPRSGPAPSKRDRAIAEALGQSVPGLTWVILGYPIHESCQGSGCSSCGGEGVAGAEFWVGVLA